MKVGDKVWLFDMNRRVYKKDGVSFTPPIYAEHFYEAVIDGETSRSWLIGRRKYPKNNPLGIFTDEQKADNIWANEKRYKIQNEISYCSIAQLKQIDLILAEKKGLTNDPR